MKISELINIIHRDRKNDRITTEELLRYINEIEWKIYREIIMTHYGSNREIRPRDLRGDNPLDLPMPCRCKIYPETDIRFDGYTAEDTGKDLIVPIPYDIVYERYIDYRLDRKAGNADSANREQAYLSAFYDFANWYAKDHMPKGAGNMRMTRYGI